MIRSKLSASFAALALWLPAASAVAQSPGGPPASRAQASGAEPTLRARAPDVAPALPAQAPEAPPVFKLAAPQEPREQPGQPLLHEEGGGARPAAVHGPAAVTPSLSKQLANVRTPPKTPGFWSYTREKGNGLKITFAVILMAILAWGWALEERGEGQRWRRSRRVAIAFLGVVGIAGWFNYGKFHHTNYIHTWEHYHYYVGAKYFPELRYSRLYECSAIAEVELGRRSLVENRKIRDLAHTNLIQPTDDVLANPQRCKQHFSEERWAAFKKDVSFFIGRMGNKRWADSQKDHGYNGTPWWNISGSILANLIGPASNQSMLWMSLLDPLLIVLMFAGIWWAFGLEIFAVAATFFAVNFPSRFYWNGGAFLRYDYLTWTVLGICLLRKKRPALGGALIATGASFRLFPALFAVGPAIQGFWRFFKERKFPREHKRIVVGALVATSLLMPASMIVAKAGLEIFSEFAGNTEKHAETPLTNHMGLRTVLSWRPWDNAKSLKNEALHDPFQIWKERRLANFEQLRWLFLALNLAFLWMVWRTSRDEPAWVAAALGGVLMIPVATELTCYYYAFMIPGAFLMEKRRDIGLWLLLLAIGTQAISRLAIWNDEKYMWMGLATIAFALIAAYNLIAPAPAAEPAPQVKERKRKKKKLEVSAG